MEEAVVLTPGFGSAADEKPGCGGRIGLSLGHRWRQKHREGELVDHPEQLAIGQTGKEKAVAQFDDDQIDVFLAGNGDDLFAQYAEAHDFSTGCCPNQILFVPFTELIVIML